jgi:hypothetical protein
VKLPGVEIAVYDTGYPPFVGPVKATLAAPLLNARLVPTSVATRLVALPGIELTGNQPPAVKISRIPSEPLK